MTTPLPVTLTILPDNRRVAVTPGATILDALAGAGVSITTPCGRLAHCAKCRVTASGDVIAPDTTEQNMLSGEELKAGVRLSCQARLAGDATVTIPSASRASEMRILVGGLTRKVAFEPAVEKWAIPWTEERAGKPFSEFEALRRELDLRADLIAEVASLRALAATAREAENQVTAVICNDRLIAIESGDTTKRRFGLALDVGTTTVVGSLVDLTTGREMGTSSAINGQTRYGHDVVSRIYHALEYHDGLAHLKDAVTGTINGIIDDLIDGRGVRSDEVYEAVVAGNTTMTHLFLGILPRSLGFLPFIPVIRQAVDLKGGDSGLRIHPAGNVHVLPNIAGFIGADTVAGLLATGMDESADDGICMLADVGTNCEIVLRVEDRLIACSTPAGPAFEGMRITHGMYAGPGAIEAVTLDGDCRFRVIGKGAPKGICGSGLVDVGAELLRVGLIDETGRLISPSDVNGALSPHLADRLIEDQEEREFVLATAGDGRRITITQGDVRELQVAKAAIRSGIEVLLDAVGLKPQDISTLYLAGGFGNYLNKRHAIRLGLLPDIPLDRIRFVGNAAVAGARLALISREIRRHAGHIAHFAEHLQIAETPDFQSRYVDAMIFEST